MDSVIVSGIFDDLRLAHVRFLDEARRFGDLHVLLWSDAAAIKVLDHPPRFPENERRYLLESLRFVNKVWSIDDFAENLIEPLLAQIRPSHWIVSTDDLLSGGIVTSDIIITISRLADITVTTVEAEMLAQIPEVKETALPPAPQKRVIVTGCYDWLHSGHVRFFEEAAAYGNLIVSVGSDDNVCLLKGEHHPLYSQAQRRYMVQAVRFVTSTVVGSGEGWMDAAPEIERLKPDFFIVNEDGDRAAKRVFCAEKGIEYVVLQRRPRQGLPKRESTHLRGF